MDTMMDIIHTYREVLSIGLVLLMTVIVIRHFWNEISFWLMDLAYSFPLFGKVKRLSGSLELNKQTGWFHTEEELAQSYINHYDRLHADPEYFDKCSSYLSRVSETGRRPFAWYMWVLIFVMVAIEAMGFSYVLAGFTVPGASENVQKLGAVGISVLVSVLLVGFTHWAGKELYTNTLMDRARSWWRHDGREGAKLMESHHEISIENNDADTYEPKYVKLLNRVSATGEAEKRYKITIFTAILVLAIAVGATWVRGVVLEQELQAEATGAVSQVQQGANASFFPQALTEPQAQADTSAIDQGLENGRKGGWGTFIVLAVIFVFMQIFGILTGFKFGFAGKESAKAYKAISRFNSRAAYEAYFKSRKTRILRTGQARLLTLQQLLARNVSDRGTTPDQKHAVEHPEGRDIYAFLEEVHRREKGVDKPVAPRPAPAPTLGSAPTPAPVEPPPSNTNTSFDETEEQMEARIRKEMAREAEDEQRRRAEEHSAREAAVRARLKAQQGD